MTIEQSFFERVARPSDISEHLGTLRVLAWTCSHITEFGVRSGNSTVAFLAGLPLGGRLVSYDCQPPPFTATNAWTFHQARTDELAEIEETDLIFFDTLHTCAQLRAELRHGNRADKWLVFHDTVTFGTVGEDGGQGLTRAILEFLEENPHWRIFAECQHNNGLLILQRR
jgi:hypothetical protein